jgi:hypothetical protein
MDGEFACLIALPSSCWANGTGMASMLTDGQELWWVPIFENALYIDLLEIVLYSIVARQQAQPRAPADGSRRGGRGRRRRRTRQHGGSEPRRSWLTSGRSDHGGGWGAHQMGSWWARRARDGFYLFFKKIYLINRCGQQNHFGK